MSDPQPTRPAVWVCMCRINRGKRTLAVHIATILVPIATALVSATVRQATTGARRSDTGMVEGVTLGWSKE